VISQKLFLLCLPAVLWTGALSDGKLLLNEHGWTFKIGFCVMSENLFLPYLLYLLAVLWTDALSGGRLRLNEHICIRKIGFWVMSEIFSSLPPLSTCRAVNCALSEGMLPLNAHTYILKIGFCVMSEKLFLLYQFAMLWTGALSEGMLPLNEHARILKIDFVWWVKNCSSFTYLLCCELLHSQMVSCLWMNMLALTLQIRFCVMSENLFHLYLL